MPGFDDDADDVVQSAYIVRMFQIIQDERMPRGDEAIETGVYCEMLGRKTEDRCNEHPNANDD
jgi:hypothetical protein